MGYPIPFFFFFFNRFFNVQLFFGGGSDPRRSPQEPRFLAVDCYRDWVLLSSHTSPTFLLSNLHMYDTTAILSRLKMLSHCRPCLPRPLHASLEVENCSQGEQNVPPLLPAMCTFHWFKGRDCEMKAPPSPPATPPARMDNAERIGCGTLWHTVGSVAFGFPRCAMLHPHCGHTLVECRARHGTSGAFLFGSERAATRCYRATAKFS